MRRRMMADRIRPAPRGAALGSREMADVDPTRSPATSPRERPARKERALVSKTIAALAVAFLLIAFGVSNEGEVPVDYLVVTRDSPLILVIGVSALLGAIIGGLIVRRRPRGRSRGPSATRAPGP
jgi:uncharacterized integral membrane protein